MGSFQYETAKRAPTQFTGIDWGNPLSARLCFMPLFGAGGLDATGLHTNSQVPTLSGNARFGNGPYGPSLELTGNASDQATFTASATLLPTGGTSDSGSIEVLFSMTAGGSRCHLFGFADSLPAVGGVQRSLIAFNGTAPCNIFAWEAAGGDLDSTVLWPADGLLHHVVFCWGKVPGEAANGVSIYLDGVLIKTGTPTLNSVGTPIITWGGHISAGTLTFVSHTYKSAIYREKLSQAQVQALWDDPWQQLLDPDVDTHSYGTAPSGNNTVAVPLSTLTLTANAPIIPVGSNQVIQPPVGVFSLQGLAPTITTGVNNLIAIPPSNLLLLGYEPRILSSSPLIDVPGSSLTISSLDPTIIVGPQVNVPLSQLTLTGLVPTVVSSGGGGPTGPGSSPGGGGGGRFGGGGGGHKKDRETLDAMFGVLDKKLARGQTLRDALDTIDEPEPEDAPEELDLTSEASFIEVDDPDNPGQKVWALLSQKGKTFAPDELEEIFKRLKDGDV